jgi:hypothetical protein
MASSFFVAEPHGATMALGLNRPDPVDFKEPAAVVDDAVAAAMAASAGGVQVAPKDEAVVVCPMPEPAPAMPAFDKMTKAEVLAYCLEQHPAGEADYSPMTKAQLVVEAEGIWTELHGPIPS